MVSIGARLVSAWLPAMVLLGAAITKAWQPDAMTAAWERLGVSVGVDRAWLTVVLVGIEATLGAALLASPAPAVRAACIALLVCSSAALGYFVLLAEPPSCGCIGPLRLFRSARSELTLGIARNLLLIAGLVLPGFGRA